MDTQTVVHQGENSGFGLHPSLTLNGREEREKICGAPPKYSCPSPGLTDEPEGKRSTPLLSSLPLTTGSHSGHEISTEVGDAWR